MTDPLLNLYQARPTVWDQQRLNQQTATVPTTSTAGGYTSTNTSTTTQSDPLVQNPDLYSEYADPTNHVQLNVNYQVPEWKSGETVHNYGSTVNSQQVYSQNSRFNQALAQAGYSPEMWLRMPYEVKRDILKNYAEQDFSRLRPELQQQEGDAERYFRKIAKAYGVGDGQQKEAGFFEATGDVLTSAASGIAKGVGQLAGLGDYLQNKLGINVDLGIQKLASKGQKWLEESVEPEEIEGKKAYFNHLIDNDRVGEAIAFMATNPIAASTVVGPEIVAMLVGTKGLGTVAGVAGRGAGAVAGTTERGAKVAEWLAGKVENGFSASSKLGKVAAGAGNLAVKGAGQRATAGALEAGGFNFEQYVNGRDTSTEDAQEAFKLAFLEQYIVQGLIPGTADSIVYKLLKGKAGQKISEKTVKEMRDFVAKADEGGILKRFNNTLERMPGVGVAKRVATTGAKEYADEWAAGTTQDLLGQNIERIQDPLLPEDQRAPEGSLTWNTVLDGDFEKAAREGNRGGVIGLFMGGAAHPFGDGGTATRTYKYVKAELDNIDAQLAGLDTTGYATSDQVSRLDSNSLVQERVDAINAEFAQGDRTNEQEYRDLLAQQQVKVTNLIDTLAKGEIPLSQAQRAITALNTQIENVNKMTETLNDQINAQQGTTDASMQGQFNKFAEEFVKNRRAAHYEEEDEFVQGVADEIRSLRDPANIPAAEQRVAQMKQSPMMQDAQFAAMVQSFEDAVNFAKDPQAFFQNQPAVDPDGVTKVNTFLKDAKATAKQFANTGAVPPVLTDVLGKKNATKDELQVATQSAIQELVQLSQQAQQQGALERAAIYTQIANRLATAQFALTDLGLYQQARTTDYQNENNQRMQDEVKAAQEQAKARQDQQDAEEEAQLRAEQARFESQVVGDLLSKVRSVLSNGQQELSADPEIAQTIKELGNTRADVDTNLEQLIARTRLLAQQTPDLAVKEGLWRRAGALEQVLRQSRGENVVRSEPAAVANDYVRTLYPDANDANEVINNVDLIAKAAGSKASIRNGNNDFSRSIDGLIQTVEQGGIESGKLVSSKVDLNAVKEEAVRYLQGVRNGGAARVDGLQYPTLSKFLFDSRVDATRGQDKGDVAQEMTDNDRLVQNQKILEARAQDQKVNKSLDELLLEISTKKENETKKPQSENSVTQLSRATSPAEFVQTAIAATRNADGWVTVESGTGDSSARGSSNNIMGNGLYTTLNHSVSSQYTSKGTKPILVKAVNIDGLLDFSVHSPELDAASDYFGLPRSADIGSVQYRMITALLTRNMPANMPNRNNAAANQLNAFLRDQFRVDGFITPAMPGGAPVLSQRDTRTVTVFLLDPTGGARVRDVTTQDKSVLPRMITAAPLYQSGELRSDIAPEQLQSYVVEQGVPAALKQLRQGFAKNDPRGKVVDSLLDLVDDNVQVQYDDLSSQGRTGYYDVETNTIVLDRNSREADIDLMHELVHAYTVYALENQAVLDEEQSAVVDEIRRAWTAARNDAEMVAQFPTIADDATGVHEFVAELLTNPRFQSAYDSMVAKTAPKGFFSSVREFFKRVATLLGLRGNEAPGLFQLINNTTSIFAPNDGRVDTIKGVAELNRKVVRQVIFANRTKEQGRDSDVSAVAQLDESTGLWNMDWWEKDGTHHDVSGMTWSQTEERAQKLGFVPKHRSSMSQQEKYVTDVTDMAYNHSGLLFKFFQGVRRVLPTELAEPFLRKFDIFVRWGANNMNNDKSWITTLENIARNAYGANIPTEVETRINTLRQRGAAELEHNGVGGKRNLRDHMDILMDLAHRSGMSREDLDDLAYALRAPHFIRRKQRASGKQDPYYKGRDLLTNTITGFGYYTKGGKKVPKGTPGATFVKDDDGSQYMASLTPQQRVFAQQFEKAIIEMNNNTLDFELAMGRIDQETYNDLYGEFYVPLQNEESEVKAYAGRIHGRSTKAGNILGKYVANSQARVNNAVESAIMREAADLLAQYPMPHMARIMSDELRTTGDKFHAAYAPEGVLDGRSKAYYRNGVRERIVITDPTFAKSMAKVGKLQKDNMTNTFIRTAGRVTRTLALSRTVFSPLFHTTAFMRDVTLVLANTQAASRGKLTDAEALQLSTRIVPRMARVLPTLLKGQWDNKKADFSYRIFMNEGGINPMAHYDLDKITGDLDMLAFNKSSVTSRAARAGKKFMQVMHFSDNAARYAAWLEFLQMRNGGREFTSERELLDFLNRHKEYAETARDISKNLTGNFEQKGASGTPRAFFMFWNAIMGGVKTTYNLVNPKYGTYGLKTLGMLSLLVALQAAGDDDKDEDGTPMWKRTNEGVGQFHIGDFKFNVAQELMIPLNTARELVRVLKGEREVGDATTKIMRSIQESVFPFQTPETDDLAFNVMYGFAPTMLQPLVGTVANKDYFGREIAKDSGYDQNGEFITNPMDHQKRRTSDSAFADWLTFEMARLGIADVAPGNIDMWVNHFIGSGGKFVLDIADDMRTEGKDPVTSFSDMLEKKFSLRYNEYAAKDEFEKEYIKLMQKMSIGESYDELINIETTGARQELKKWYTDVGKQIKAVKSSQGYSASDLYTMRKQLELQLSPPHDEVLSVKEQLNEIQTEQKFIYLRALEELRERAERYE